MKELPLLSSDFEPFLWSQSNGEASLEQTQESFNALYNKDMCYKFSYLVWNDLVDKLNDALTQAGLTWKTTYGTVSSTKLTDKLTDFTARRFNSVAYNIDHLINNSWKWAVVPDVTGFLGRARVKGYAEVGDNADAVYGWYLIELARVVNLFIDILKNEADFSELIYEESISTNLNDGIRGGEAEKLEYDESVRSSVDGGVRIGDGQQVEIESLSESNSDTDIVAGDGIRIETDSISETTFNDGIRGGDGERLEYDESIETTLNDGIRSGDGEKLKYAESIETSLHEETRAGEAERLKYAESIETSLHDEIRSGEAERLKYTESIETSLDGGIITGDAQKVETDEISTTKTDAEMIAVVPTYTGAEDISYSNYSLDVLDVVPTLTGSDAYSDSLASAEIHQIECFGFGASGVSKTMSSVEFLSGITERMKASLISRFNVFAKLSFDSGAISDWVEQVGSNLYIRQAHKFINEENNGYFDRTVDVTFWVDPIKEGSDLYIRMDFHEEGD